MPPFVKPVTDYVFNLEEEIAFLDAWRKKRKVPRNVKSRLLICTWNIANLGAQDRTDDHYKLIAHIISWFDVVAIQEVNDDLTGLIKIESFLDNKFQVFFSDKGGNEERAAFIFNSEKVKRLSMTAEVAIPQKEQHHIKFDSVRSKFRGFDRNPYLATFKFRDFEFMLINAHSYFGSNGKRDMERRILETYAIARYADLRHDDKHVYVPNIIALGDFNIPKAEKGDAVHDALLKRGLKLPEHSTIIASNINNDKYYDQIAFFPSLKSKIKAHGVYDFDGGLFPDLWNNYTTKQFLAYCRYYISDHRPMWIELDVG